MKKRFRPEKGEKHQDEESLQESGEENENELGGESLKVEFGLKKIGPIEKEKSGNGIEAKQISRKEVEEIPQQEGQDCARHGWE